MVEKNKGTTLVQMRLQPKTMERIDNLCAITGTTNRTQLIATSVELAEELMSNVKEGAKIYIVKTDGTKELIRIIGF
jgi:predicted DNA-binding protein